MLISSQTALTLLIMDWYRRNIYHGSNLCWLTIKQKEWWFIYQWNYDLTFFRQSCTYYILISNQLRRWSIWYVSNRHQLIGDQIQIFDHWLINITNLSIFLHLFHNSSLSIVKKFTGEHIFYVSNIHYLFDGKMNLFGCWLIEQTNLLVLFCLFFYVIPFDH